MTGTYPSQPLRGSLTLSPMGEAGWLCSLPDEPLDPALQQRIMALAGYLASHPAVLETVPGMNNLLVLYDPSHPAVQLLPEVIGQAWAVADAPGSSGDMVEIPVIYGGASGVDLAECAAHAGMSPDAFARLHADGIYTVFALGSHPGFAYLGGLDERLRAPRRAVPRPRVAAGAVMIGGQQTGVQACDNPTGWNLIGQTETRFFDPVANPPALLQPGMRVRFILQEIVL